MSEKVTWRDLVHDWLLMSAVIGPISGMLFAGILAANGELGTAMTDGGVPLIVAMVLSCLLIAGYFVVCEWLVWRVGV